MNLAERVIELHRALAAEGIDHAFGGAIALAYWTNEPRGTRDIDLNIFVPAERCAPALEALPAGISHDEQTVATIERDGQIRLWWDDTPVDLFFDYAAVHHAAASHRRRVPLEGVEIPVIGPVELAIFKAMFDRTRDWADIEAMIAAKTLDVEAVEQRLNEMVGSDDQRIARLRRAVELADPAGSA